MFFVCISFVVECFFEIDISQYLLGKIHGSREKLYCQSYRGGFHGSTVFLWKLYLTMMEGGGGRKGRL